MSATLSCGSQGVGTAKQQPCAAGKVLCYGCLNPSLLCCLLPACCAADDMELDKVAAAKVAAAERAAAAAAGPTRVVHLERPPAMQE